MRKIKPQKEKPPEHETLLGIPIEVAAPVAQEAKPADERVSIPVTPDGKIQWDRLRSETKGRVEGILRANQAPGASPAGPVDYGADPFGYMLAPAILRILTNVEALVAAYGKLMPPERARAIFLCSDEELQPAVKPAAKVLNKHLGSRLGRFQEEVELGGTLLAIHLQKLEAYRRMEASRPAEETTAPAKPNGRPVSIQPEAPGE